MDLLDRQENQMIGLFFGALFQAAALFVLFAAAAGAGIVVGQLFVYFYRRFFDRAVAVAGRSVLGGFGHLLALGLFLGADLHGQQHLHGVLTDGGHHIVEHIEAFQTVFHHRIPLAVGPQVDALAGAHPWRRCDPSSCVSTIRSRTTRSSSRMISVPYFCFLAARRFRWPFSPTDPRCRILFDHFPVRCTSY